MPSITFHSNRLYAVSGSETHYLDLSFDSTTYTDKPTQGPTTLSPWSSLHPTTTSKTAKHPASSSSTALVSITTGQGRNYLLHLTSSTLSTLQLTSSKTTAASLKDRARKAISKKTAEGEWAEVRYFNAENVMIQEGQAGRGVGDRKGFATTKVKEIDGGMVLVWGGVDGRGRVRSDGLMIEVEK